MIYDLKKLNDESYDVREFGNPASDVDILQIRALLAIAERLEALVEAQKPRWVEFTNYYKELPVTVNPNRVVLVGNSNDDDSIYITFDGDEGGYVRVKGTLAEVMDKLRGDK